MWRPSAPLVPLLSSQNLVTDDVLPLPPRSKEAKLLRTMKFPKEYSLKPDLTRVNWEVMKARFCAASMNHKLPIVHGLLPATLFATAASCHNYWLLQQHIVNLQGHMKWTAAVNAQVWIAQRVTELLGVEDDVLIGYVYEQLEDKKVTSDPDSVCWLPQLVKLEPQLSAYPTAVRRTCRRRF